MPDVLGHEAGDKDAQQPEHPGHHEHPGVAHDVKQDRDLIREEEILLKSLNFTKFHL